MSAIFKREFRSYFSSPVGYVVLAIMFIFAGYAFFMYNMYAGSTSLSYVFYNMYQINLMLVLPVLTMRLFSEEKRQKTDQALFTAPTSLTGIVIGKFLAALALFAIGLSIALVFAIIIAFQVSPDWLVVIGNYVGMLMLGGMIIAIGLLISSLTESQFIAALCTFGVSFMLMLLDNLSSIFQGVSWINSVVAFLSINTRYYNFTLGLINYDDLVFFLSVQAIFIFLTIRTLDRKRWS